jgi:hypothetical protein
MKIEALLLIALPCVAGCITDENRCPDGLLWVPEYSGCVEPAEAGDGEASTQVEAGGDSLAESSSEAAQDSGLGTSCSGDPVCAGKKASYCLKDPQNPSADGVCSIPNCTAADCGDTYTCCDCHGSTLLNWPGPMCAPIDRKSQLTGVLNCTCS